MKKKMIIAGIGIAAVLAAGTAFFRQPGGNEKEPEYIESAFARWGQQVAASVGELRFPVFMVEFQDIKFRETMVSLEELEEWIFTGEESVAEYYNISSYGRLHMDGDVYHYTAQGNMADYESYENLEKLIAEMLEYYDETVDFTQYDQNGDGVLDVVTLSVPKGGNPDFWWAATHTWWSMPDYTIDGLYLMKFLVNDAQPYKDGKDFYINAMEHELGHCMGLPDYYKYEYEGTDYQGLHGVAGTERMDDSKGDFCQFSKLQLGWLREDQVQIMPDDVASASFLLPPVKEGGCVLVFPRGTEPDFQGEYFVVEYNTNEGLQKGLFQKGGIRVLHVQAEMLVGGDGFFYYRYENFTEEYDKSNEGIRILKMVNDWKDFSRTGDTITFESAGGEKGNFGWYTEDGRITDPGFSIRIGEVQEESGYIQIEILWDDLG